MEEVGLLQKLKARWVLGFDGSDHRLYENGEVVIDGAQILHAGARSETSADRDEDLGNVILVPGFIDLNATGDTDQTILGFGGDMAPGAKAWSAAYAARAHDVLTTEQMVIAARGAFCQLMLSGVTSALPVTSLLFQKWAEDSGEYEAISALSGELGLRLFLGPTFRSYVNVLEDDGRVGQVADEAAGLAGLEDAIRFIERNHGGHGGLVSGLLLPSTIETCSDQLMRRTAEAARSLDVPFRLHCCQSRTEVDLIWKRSGKSPVAHLENLGVLSQRALLPHALYLGGPNSDPELVKADRAALAASGSTVVNCPLMSARFGKRLETFSSFVEEGIRVGLGTDMAPANMLMNLQMGLVTARAGNAAAARPADIFRAATLGGALALGRPDLGRLAKGAAADIVAWDLSALTLQPVHDPIEALFLMPAGVRAQHSWVAGRNVIRDGKLTAGIDEARLAAEMQGVFELRRKSFEERNPGQRPWQELFPPAYPVHRNP